MTSLYQSLTSFFVEIEEAKNIHSDVVRETAYMIDQGNDPDLEEDLDDFMSELKGHLSSKLANEVTDDEASRTIDLAEMWVTENISNAETETRVAAAIALLGLEQFEVRFESKEIA